MLRACKCCEFCLTPSMMTMHELVTACSMCCQSLQLDLPVSDWWINDLPWDENVLGTCSFRIRNHRPVCVATSLSCSYPHATQRSDGLSTKELKSGEVDPPSEVQPTPHLSNNISRLRWCALRSSCRSPFSPPQAPALLQREKKVLHRVMDVMP